MARVVATIAVLLALYGSAESGLTKQAHSPHVLNSFLLSGWCNDLPFRDEDAQLRRDQAARETDPLDALINLLETRYPCGAK